MPNRPTLKNESPVWSATYFAIAAGPVIQVHGPVGYPLLTEVG